MTTDKFKRLASHGGLEALEAVAALRLLTDNVEHGVDELRTLRVVALRPVVAGASRPVEIEGGGKT